MERKEIDCISRCAFMACEGGVGGWSGGALSVGAEKLAGASYFTMCVLVCVCVCVEKGGREITGITHLVL